MRLWEFPSASLLTAHVGTAPYELGSYSSNTIAWHATRVFGMSKHSYKRRWKGCLHYPRIQSTERCDSETCIKPTFIAHRDVRTFSGHLETNTSHRSIITTAMASFLGILVLAALGF